MGSSVLQQCAQGRDVGANPKTPGTVLTMWLCGCLILSPLNLKSPGRGVALWVHPPLRKHAESQENDSQSGSRA